MNNELTPGTWILLKEGYTYREYYVLRVKDNAISLGSRNWLVSSACWTTLNDVRNNYIILGHGKFKWWWKYIPFKNLICPFTTPEFYDDSD